VCPCRLRIFSLTLTEKSKEKEDASHVGRRAISGITAQIRPNPRRGRSKARCLQWLRLGMILPAKMNPPRNHGHHSSSCSSHSLHKCLMARGKSSIPSSSDDACDGEGKSSLDELAHVVQFFEDVCTKQKLHLKL
jgi:hypothetical protein